MAVHGRVGRGADELVAELLRLADLLGPIECDAPPVENAKAAPRGAIWVQPKYVCEVEYGEFTPGGILRHPRWRGLRPDKSPAEVRREN